jgi:hypothetical protein
VRRYALHPATDIEAMPRIKLLVISNPDPDMMRELQKLEDSCEIFVSDNESELRQWIPTAEVVLYRGLSGKSLSLSDLWQQTRAGSIFCPAG